MIHTLDRRLGTTQFLQRDYLSLDVTVLVYQHGRRVPLWVPLNAHIGAYLTELDIAVFGRKLPPDFDQTSRFGVCSL